MATLEFQEKVYAPDAPAAMNVKLQEGNSGPAVRQLQENLAALQIYDGAIDSVYDVDVVEAVKVFQGAYGYTLDGVATTEVQKAIYYEAGRMKTLFESEGGYTLQKVDEEIPMGTINCELGVRLREGKSTESKKKGLLKQGDVIVVLEKGEKRDDWSQVQKGKNSGYVQNKYVDFFSQTISSLRYVSEGGGNTTYTIGYTASDYYSGADRPADKFSDYLASGGALDSYNDLVEYATVATGDDTLPLNLREQPNTDSEIEDMLPNGTQVTVRQHDSEWSLVDYNGTSGYLLNQYLEFWTGGENALQTVAGPAEDIEVEEDDEIEHAEVACDDASKAPVYEEDSADAKVLGSLKNGTQVDVLQTMDGWSLISYQDHQGYMREQDLRFLMAGVQT